MTDEVPVEGSTVQVVLGDEILGAVLADEADTRVTQDSQVLRGNVLGRHEDAHVGRVAADGRCRLRDSRLDVREPLAHGSHVGDVLSDHCCLLGALPRGVPGVPYPELHAGYFWGRPTLPAARRRPGAGP